MLRVNLKYERLKALGYTELDIEHLKELHKLIAERDAKYQMPWLITREEFERREQLGLPNGDFALFDPYKRFKLPRP